MIAAALLCKLARQRLAGAETQRREYCGLPLWACTFPKMAKHKEKKEKRRKEEPADEDGPSTSGQGLPPHLELQRTRQLLPAYSCQLACKRARHGG